MFQYHSFYIMGFPGGSVVENPPANAGEDPLEKEMATHSSVPAWGIPWAEEPAGLQSRGSKKLTQRLKENNTTK